jgi:uncharacterized RDD family membrane protein YckC
MYAGFVSRGVAWVVDNVIMVAIATVVTVVTAVVLDAILPHGVKADTPEILATAVGWATFTTLYFVGFWVLAGQTPGMRLLGLVVVRTNGARVGVGHALRRLVGLVISILTLGLGFLLVLVDDRRQGLADKLAGTLVLYAGESGLATRSSSGSGAARG